MLLLLKFDPPDEIMLPSLVHNLVQNIQNLSQNLLRVESSCVKPLLLTGADAAVTGAGAGAVAAEGAAAAPPC